MPAVLYVLQCAMYPTELPAPQQAPALTTTRNVATTKPASPDAAAADPASPDAATNLTAAAAAPKPASVTTSQVQMHTLDASAYI